MKFLLLALSFLVVVSIARCVELTEIESTESDVPVHVLSYCQAQFEVYDVPFDNCIASYNKHRRFA